MDKWFITKKTFDKVKWELNLNNKAEDYGIDDITLLDTEETKKQGLI